MIPGSEAAVLAAVEAVLGGRPESFRTILERYRKPVLAFIFNLTGSAESAEDIGQEVFLKAYQALPGFDPSRGIPFSTWLFSIARNACLDFRRRNRSLQARDEAFAQAERGNGDRSPGLDEEGRLQQALAGLSEEQRMAVEWVFVQGMSYEEASRLEKVSVGTLASRLARAKERLRSLLRGPAGGKETHGR